MREKPVSATISVQMCFIGVMPVGQFVMIAALYNGDAE